MALIQKLSEEDKALLEVVEDPIWLGEFLRTTSDGEIDKNLWPAIGWKYRDYQRQFLSDNTEFIIYTGGRAIGKCSPGNARVYTTEGYKTLNELHKKKYFTTYALTPQLQIEQRRAIAIPDKITSAFTVKTASGHTFTATKNHPILTPNGYRLMEDLSVGDDVAVVTQLPHISNEQALQWYELRLIAYVFLEPRWRAEHPIRPRWKAIGNELEAIAEAMLINWHKTVNGVYTFQRKPGPFKHPINALMQQIQLFHALRQYGAYRVPDIIKRERLENIQIFLEGLFAQFGELSKTKVTIKTRTEQISLDIQELLLRFGIESKIGKSNNEWILELLDYRAVYRFWQQFKLPGVSVGRLPTPNASADATEFLRFEHIISKEQSYESVQTYAVYVYIDNNYIGDNLFVHNSVVLEDKIIYDVVNQDIQLPVTPEIALVTANQNQMTPLLNRVILRFSASKLLKSFLRNNINRQEGVMKFPIWSAAKPLIFHFRIAGSRGENNMVGLHIPRIIGDEMQLFPLNAFTQLQPAYNQWEPKRQQVHAGVPNGLRNSVLYLLDQQTRKYKKYHIPSHNNPYYTQEDDIDNIKKYGGENDDRYQQLVLGRHGSAAFQVIPRETITTETFQFYNYRYNSGHIHKGLTYKDVLDRPKLPETVVSTLVAIDPGFVDPTVIQIIGADNKGIWRTYVRYRLTRIDFNEQERIIDWIASFYKAENIAIDIGAGGNGAAIMHNLMNRDEYKSKNYAVRIHGIQFKENVIAGYDTDGEELVQDAKGYAANELAKIIQETRLVMSELDSEGISQLERVAKQRGTSGKDRYFVMNDKGNGVSDDDHIFASYICFILAIKDQVLNPNKFKKLGIARGAHTVNAPQGR